MAYQAVHRQPPIGDRNMFSANFKPQQLPLIAMLLVFFFTRAYPADVPAGVPAGATTMALPSDFDWVPLLAVIRLAPGKYTVDKTADDLRLTMIQGKVVTPYYVDPINGKDTNSGQTQDLALKTMQAAANKSAGDISEVIIVAPPSRLVWGENAMVNGFAHSAMIHAMDDQEVIFCKCSKPMWTAVGNGTFTTVGPTGTLNTSIVMDWSPQARATSPEGGGLGYERVADAAAVAGMPATFYHDATSGLVTVCPFAERNLVGDEFITVPADNEFNCWSMQTPSAATAGRFYWARGCHWIGGLNPLGLNNNSAVSARSLYVFDHCGMWAGSSKGNAMAAVGPNDIYNFDGIGGYSGADLWNLHGNGHGSGRIFHVRPRCTVRNGFGNTGRDNVDTVHEDSRGITVMPIYAHADGRVYGYIDRARGVVFGGSIGPSLRTDDFCASVNAGGRTVVDLFEVTLVPSKGPYTLTADGTTPGSGATIRGHGMDIANLTKRGANIASAP